MSQFAGKTAVISGGAEGIGLSIAKASRRAKDEYCARRY